MPCVDMHCIILFPFALCFESLSALSFRMVGPRSREGDCKHQALEVQWKCGIKLSSGLHADS